MKTVLHDCLSRIQRTFVDGLLRPRLLAAFLLAASGFYFGLLRSSSTSGQLPVATNDSIPVTGKRPIQSPISNRYPPAETTIKQERISIAALPPRVTDALSNSWKVPHQLDDSSIGLVSEEVVLRSFSEHFSPSNRVAHLSILEAVGGESAATALIHMLTEEFSGGVLSIRDYYSMVDAVYSLGCISTRSARAKGFLEQAISEEFWAQKRKWLIAPQNHFEDTDMNFWLARESLKALAVGGHEEVLILAQQVRDSPFQIQKKWAGTVVDTIFLFDRAKLRSGPFLPEDGEKLASAFEQWGETERGRYWRDWSQSIRETATQPGK